MKVTSIKENILKKGREEGRGERNRERDRRKQTREVKTKAIKVQSGPSPLFVLLRILTFSYPWDTTAEQMLSSLFPVGRTGLCLVF